MTGATTVSLDHASSVEPDTLGFTDLTMFDEWTDFQEYEGLANGPQVPNSVETSEIRDEDPGQQVDEPSVTEYARFHRLCIDYSSKHPLTNHGLSIDQITFGIELQDHDGLKEPELSDALLAERLTIDRDTAAYIKNVLAEPGKANELDAEPPAVIRTAAMKQELPLLSTDNELDLKNFRHMMSPDFDNANLPLEPVDEENNEGLTWPQQFHHLPNQFDAKSKSEKLEITKDALIYLRATLRHDLGSYDLDEIERVELTYRKASVSTP